MELTLKGKVVHIEAVSKDTPTRELLNRKLTSRAVEDTEDPFYVVDLGRLVELYRMWCSALPTVTPFYAVKCNDDLALLKTLAALGTGFDCASKVEIKTVLDLGVAPNRIVYANPCKQISHLQYAARKEVDLMTFDNEPELYKIQAQFPSARLLLRIRADDPDALCQLGLKFGCTLPEARTLLSVAQELQLTVIGISFHVGSGSQSPPAYKRAIAMAAELFEFSQELGHDMTLLDIGGGFPGDKGSDNLFQQVASAINTSLETHFSQYPRLKVIAEPGRFFACSTHTIAVNVTSKRVHSDPKKEFMYYVNDGVYGSFNCILYDHTTPTPKVLEEHSGPVYQASLWGPTCDGLDKLGDSLLPELSIGDWLYFENMGAYTVAASSTFNGFLKPQTHYHITHDKLEFFHELFSPAEMPSCSASPSPAVSLPSSCESLSRLAVEY